MAIADFSICTIAPQAYFWAWGVTLAKRQPSRAVLGVWIWAILYNVVGFAILAALWWTMR